MRNPEQEAVNRDDVAFAAAWIGDKCDQVYSRYPGLKWNYPVIAKKLLKAMVRRGWSRPSPSKGAKKKGPGR